MQVRPTHSVLKAILALAERATASPRRLDDEFMAVPFKPFAQPVALLRPHCAERTWVEPFHMDSTDHWGSFTRKFVNDMLAPHATQIRPLRVWSGCTGQFAQGFSLAVSRFHNSRVVQQFYLCSFVQDAFIFEIVVGFHDLNDFASCVSCGRIYFNDSK